MDFLKIEQKMGNPEHWILATRLSEGGGKLLWDEQNKPRPSPGIELDREGALFLQQAIAIEPGAVYRVGAEIKTEDVEGSACLQMDFFDAYGGSMFQDITKTPMGELFTGSNDWTSDSFEVRVPPRATYGELRLFLNNKGRAFMKNVMLSKI